MRTGIFAFGLALVLAALGPSPSLGPAVTDNRSYIDGPLGFRAVDVGWYDDFGALSVVDTAFFCGSDPATPWPQWGLNVVLAGSAPYSSGVYTIPGGATLSETYQPDPAGHPEVFTQFDAVSGVVVLNILGPGRASGSFAATLLLPDGGSSPVRGAFVAPTCVR